MNELEIRKTFEIFKGNNQLVEVRAIDGKNVLSGYFDNASAIVSNISKLVGNYQIYFVMNQIKEACKCREQYGRMIPAHITTSDSDIEGRTWFLIDIDPIRPAGVSATDKEKDIAKQVAHNIFIYLDNMGFSKPIIADSGNGYHLIYRISLVNNTENTNIIK